MNNHMNDQPLPSGDARDPNRDEQSVPAPFDPEEFESEETVWPDLPGFEHLSRSHSRRQAADRTDYDLPSTSSTSLPLRARAAGASQSPYLLPKATTTPTYLQPRSATQLPVPQSTTLLSRRTSATHQECPNCGSMQPTSTSVCMACGTFFPAIKAQTIRCRRCGTQASAHLSICPGCGRKLEPARSRLLSWIGPIAVVLLFLLLLQRWNQLTPAQWIASQLEAGQSWISAMSQRLDPQITIATIPSAETDGNRGQSAQANVPVRTVPAADLEPLVIAQADNGISSSANTGAVASVTGETESGEVTTNDNGNNDNGNNDNGNNGSIESEQGDGAINESAASAALLPTATSLPSATATVVPTASPTASSTATPPPTATASPTRLTATATASDTDPALDGVETAVSNADSVTNPTRRSILLPTNTPRSSTQTAEAATATPAPSSTPTASPTALPTALPTETATAIPTPVPTVATVTYVIKSGDTPSSIAAIYDISVNELLAANGLGLEDARRLRVGQELVIPTGEQSAPAATPTTANNVPTNTPASAPTTLSTATVPTATPATTIRLDAPQLRSPESGAFLSCGGNNALIWLPVSFIREDDTYLLHLGFVNGYNTDGTDVIAWVLEQQLSANETIWRMDEGLCSLAPQEFGRQWRWYVEVVEQGATGLQRVSIPSATWSFSWN